MRVLTLLPFAAIAGLLSVSLPPCPADAAPRSPVEGVWMNEEGDGYIALSVEKNGKLVGVGVPGPGADPERRDINNPDPKKRNRKLAGVRILWGFEPDNEEKTEWEDGYIYDPGNGKTYSCKLRLEGGELRIRGYVGISLFGRTTVWSRAPDAVQEATRKAM